ncbi:serine/threonine-protein kinase RIO1-like isoform X1 [Mytilus californianus]|uniref:serine/threonine-protein kinase RIO1-like isoform X1 n=2 Tax=Mytilus californianus TaxID=6549 RepID=UPI0022454DB1|nr:serine/threonine-protein kinase RIO1-like isoform X1 [Mytilus californianus]
MSVRNMSTDTVEGQFDDADIESCVSSSNNKITETDIVVKDEDWDDDFDDDDDDDGDLYDWYGETGDFTKKYNAAVSNSQQPNAFRNKQVKTNTTKNFQPVEKTMKKYVDKINVEKYAGPQLSNKAMSALVEKGRKMDNERYRGKDKADRATAEQVMDKRTRLILFKFLSKGIISEINGCISTGKEANVYHATGKDQDMAVKVYKTSILVFKDRDKYVSGEFRFRHGYCKHNPRKMVQTWAEKEMRNLIRIHQAGVLCPEPILLKSHVLVMSFIGTDGWPAPLLKDSDISESKARELYLECIHMVRTLYHQCKLIHADLSEFNMLYHNGNIYVIDVSQSVEHDHVHALEFLRKDCTNITDFFRKKGVCTLTVKELFDFVTDITINEDNIDHYLEQAMTLTSTRSHDDVTEQQKIDEQVFKNSYIPRTLDEVIDYERDFIKAQKGDSNNLLYQTVTGLKADLTGPQQRPKLLENADDCNRLQEDIESNKDSASDSDTESSENENDDQSESSNKTKSYRPREESPDSKRERKKIIKEEQREKRKNKIPKHVKKRKEKSGSKNTKKGKT